MPRSLKRTGIRSLDRALYVASCFARSAPKRTVRIWSLVEKKKEEYRVEDSGVSIVGAWRPVYDLTSVEVDS